LPRARQLSGEDDQGAPLPARKDRKLAIAVWMKRNRPLAGQALGPPALPARGLKGASSPGGRAEKRRHIAPARTEKTSGMHSSDDLADQIGFDGTGRWGLAEN